MTESKKPAKKPRAKKYDEKVAVKGTFLEIMKAAAKNANDNSAKKKGE